MPTPLIPKPLGKTRPILQSADPEHLTLHQETDARTAICRGLKEYVEQLSFQSNGGRLLRFAAVYDTWAEPEDQAQFPAAAVEGIGEGSYDASRFTPGAIATDVPGQALVLLSEFTMDVRLDVWATDSKERMFLMAMLERALAPSNDTYSFALELPHYFNARAIYSLSKGSYDDSDLNAIRKYRRAYPVLQATLPVMRPASVPTLRPGQPQVSLEVVEPPAVLDPTLGQVFFGMVDP